jgi:hypothetical protein
VFDPKETYEDLIQNFNICIDSLQLDPVLLLQILADDQWAFPYGRNETDIAIKLLDIWTSD